MSGERLERLEPPDGYNRLFFRITGVSPLLMHSGQLADPSNPFAKDMKKISGKKAKTEADYEALARLEFLGGLYLFERRPCIPGEMVEATLVNAAKRVRRGPQATVGILSDGAFPLTYPGPRDPVQLWEDRQFRLTVGVRLQKARVMRTRPLFRRWSADLVIDYMPEHLNSGDVEEFVGIAGRAIGFGDWRPRYGRFTAERL